MKNASRPVRFLSLSLTALLLLVSVWSQHAMTVVAPEVKAKTEQTAKDPQKSASHRHAVVSELSPMAVVAPVVLHFAQDFFLLPPVTFALQAFKNLLPPAPPVSIRLTYFEVLFRHFIVINAP